MAAARTMSPKEFAEYMSACTTRPHEFRVWVETPEGLWVLKDVYQVDLNRDGSITFTTVP